MDSGRESIHADTYVDVEGNIKAKDEIRYTKRKTLVLKIYFTSIIVINLLIFTINSKISTSELFLIAGIVNVLISLIGIYSHYIGQGIKQDFTNFKAPGGMLANMAVVENQISQNREIDKPMFTVFNPSATIYLSIIPLIIGVIFIILGFFVV